MANCLVCGGCIAVPAVVHRAVKVRVPVLVTQRTDLLRLHQQQIMISKLELWSAYSRCPTSRPAHLLRDQRILPVKQLLVLDVPSKSLSKTVHLTLVVLSLLLNLSPKGRVGFGCLVQFHLMLDVQLLELFPELVDGELQFLLPLRVLFLSS
jgi:hypothetical protein